MGSGRDTLGRYPDHDELIRCIAEIRKQRNELRKALAATELASLATIEELRTEVERLRGQEFTREELEAIVKALANRAQTCHRMGLTELGWQSTIVADKARAILEATECGRGE